MIGNYQQTDKLEQMNCHSNEDHLYTIRRFLYSDIKVYTCNAHWQAQYTQATAHELLLSHHITNTHCKSQNSNIQQTLKVAKIEREYQQNYFLIMRWQEIC